MIVRDFKNTCHQYENFAIWAVKDMEDFFDDNESIVSIFEALYDMPIARFFNKTSGIQDSNIKIIEKVLEKVVDKFFFIFTYHSDNHSELVQMQERKIMSFGIDINDIPRDRVCICMMNIRPEELM